MEFKVTALAERKIKEVVELHNEVPVLRIYVERAFCSGARFGIAFDYIREGDEITEVNGIQFITDSEYMPRYSDGISIDYVTNPKEGFIIKSLRSVTSGCGGGCGSRRGCTGCGLKNNS
ncbi:iron-sulfur cluster biosynthesis family protein [Fonticella tunisiensis]|uniref:Fe-S cluster assembly iron-binding protein IscA n=1 Tax=Fonticella tunisiensis TaxID=1096341 RepID=A0A4R7KQG1_9CLOT|nr:iron-sulfur cluster biosynthesis family protein [Fonticella tunisiensis]TDT60924.1 Fe-S cluster assembly iron-binding protein IscA [Fonticella tunisiensis]